MLPHLETWSTGIEVTRLQEHYYHLFFEEETLQQRMGNCSPLTKCLVFAKSSPFLSFPTELFWLLGTKLNYVKAVYLCWL